MVAIGSDESPSSSHHCKGKRLMKLQEEEDYYINENKEKEKEQLSLDDAKPIGEPVRVSGIGKTE